MKKDPQKRLSVADGFKVMKLIEAHGAMDGGIFVYHAGWDDARIAGEVGCLEGAIAYRRKEAFGSIRAKAAPKPLTQAAALDDLRRRVEVLEQHAKRAVVMREHEKTNGTTEGDSAQRPFPRFMTS